MTQEEKAKAYDEALIKILPLYERAKKDDCPIWSTYEYIFPVLRESDDERIRKRIRLCLDECVHSDIIRDYERDECITYLENLKEPADGDFARGYDCGYECCLHSHGAEWFEKQKEPAPIPDKFSGLKSLMLQYLQSAANRKDDTEIESDTDLWGRKILDYVWKYDGLQGEQKPTEWKLPDNFEEAVYKVANFISPFSSQEELRKVSHRFAEQLLDMAKKELQKPAEWSEENEKKLQKCIEIIEMWEGDYNIACSPYSNLLKSLHPQPHWQPSKEQMESLECWKSFIHPATPMGGALESLYNDLKKL